ncbi:MAG: hypothetical protein AAGU05_10645, partial [Anaerolineaceae bacterium]
MIRLAEGFVRTNRTEDAQHLARLLKSMPDMEAGQYFRLANLMAQMGDWETAVGLLEQTLERGYSPTAHVYFALAAMEQMQDHFDAALSFSQQALKAEPENRFLLIHQADLLYRLDKPQAAFTCLEQVEGSQTIADEIITGNPFFDGLDGDLHLKAWLVEIKDGTGIAIRKGLYLRKLNRYAEALETVKSAYKQTGAEKLLVLLDDLSMRNADLAQAKTLRKDSRNLRDKSLKQAASILHLRLHLLLGDVEGIKKILADGAVARYNTTEWHCAQCLISQAEHNWDAAMQNYRQARTLWSNKTVLHKQNKMAGLNGYSLAEEMLNDQPYWMWMTAAGLLLWDESLNGFEAAHQIDANHAFIQFGYLKALTLAGEWQMLAKELELEKRKPVFPKGLEETRFFVQGLINHSSGKTQSADVRRWLVRADILFSEKAVDAKGISEQLQMPEDLEFLAGLLRGEKKFNPAAEIAGKLSRHFTNVW